MDPKSSLIGAFNNAGQEISPERASQLLDLSNDPAMRQKIALDLEKLGIQYNFDDLPPAAQLGQLAEMNEHPGAAEAIAEIGSEVTAYTDNVDANLKQVEIHESTLEGQKPNLEEATEGNKQTRTSIRALTETVIPALANDIQELTKEANTVRDHLENESAGLDDYLKTTDSEIRSADDSKLTLASIADVSFLEKSIQTILSSGSSMEKDAKLQALEDQFIKQIDAIKAYLQFQRERTVAFREKLGPKDGSVAVTKNSIGAVATRLLNIKNKDLIRPNEQFDFSAASSGNQDAEEYLGYYSAGIDDPTAQIAKISSGIIEKSETTKTTVQGIFKKLRAQALG